MLETPVKPSPSGSDLLDRFDRKLIEFKSKFKSTCITGFDRYTDQFDRFTGSVGPVTGVLTKKSDDLKEVSRFDWFTGRFDRFTGRHMRWALMGLPIFSFSFLI